MTDSDGILAGWRNVILNVMLKVLLSFKGQYLAELIDIWVRIRPGGRNGDCDDITIGCYYELKERGFPIDKMFLAIVDLVGGRQHAVLVVELDDGHWVLDCRLIEPVRWNDPNANYFRWWYMWPIEEGRGWIILRGNNDDFMKTGKRQNVNPPPQLKRFRKTLEKDN